MRNGSVVILGLFLPSLAISYSPVAWAAAVPLTLAFTCIARLPDAVQRLRRVGAQLVFLGVLLLSALLSAALHPSAQAGLVVATLAACVGLSLLLALGAPREAVPLLLGAATLTALLLLAWVVLVDPALVGTKSVLVRGGVAGWLLGRHVTAGRGIAHPNMVGVVAAMVVPGWLALALAARRSAVRVAWSSLLVLCVAMLGISGSRGGLIAAGAGALIVIVLRFKRAIWLLVALITIAIAAMIGWGVGSAVVRLMVVGSGNDQARLPVWQASLSGILQAPWTGRGIGSFPFAYSRIPGADPIANGTHNAFLQVWLDFGLIGFVALCGLTGLLFLNCLRASRRDPTMHAVAGVAVAWLVVSLLESTVIVSWRIAPPWEGFQEAAVPLAFAVWGLAAAPFMAREPAGATP